jgi:hypothetical protein
MPSGRPSATPPCVRIVVHPKQPKPIFLGAAGDNYGQVF